MPKLAIKLIYIRSPWAGSCNKFNNIKKIVQYIPTVQYIIVNKIKRVVAYLISDSVVLNTKEDILKSVGKRVTTSKHYGVSGYRFPTFTVNKAHN